MKQYTTMSVGDILDLYIDNGGNRKSFDKEKALYLWSEIVGPVINQATFKRYIEGDTMHIYINSAAIKNELMYVTEPLVQQINNAVGSHVISKLIIH